MTGPPDRPAIRNAFRWFGRTPPLTGGPEPLALEGAPSWGSLGRSDLSSRGTVRTRALSAHAFDALRDEVHEVLDADVSANVLVHLLAAEWAPLAATAPGSPLLPRWEPVVADLAAAPPDELSRLLVRLRAASLPALHVPAPHKVPARWGAQLDDRVVVRVRTAGPNWLPRPPLPPAYYDTERPIEVPTSPDTLRPFLESLREEPPLWRTDVWFQILGVVEPVLLADLVPAELVEEVAADTVFAWPLAATMEERAILAGGYGPRVEAALGLGDEASRALFVAGRDWRTGDLDLTRPEVARLVLEPLRDAIVAGRTADARALAERALRLGAPDLLLEDRFVADGTASGAEWAEIVGDRGAG